MARTVNGTLWKLLPWATGIVLLALSSYAGYITLGRDVADNTEDIAQNTERIDAVKDGLKEYVWPEIEASKQHRTVDDLNQQYMDKRFDRIEATQRQILEEVRK